MKRPRASASLAIALLLSTLAVEAGPASAAAPTRAKLRRPDGNRPFGVALYEEEAAERAIEVAVVRLPIRDTTLIVRAKGVRLGAIRIVEGVGELEVDNTTGDTVPKIRPDDRLTIRRRNGVLILSGTF